MFKTPFQVSRKFNFAIETISNTSLEPNYRVALMELEHRTQSHMSCIYFCVHTSNTCKMFLYSYSFVNKLKLANNLS